MESIKAKTIADYLISLASENPDNNDMTNLKVQKLLYYVQGTHLSLYRTRLFDEKIIKWQYGPVVPEVYQDLKTNGNQIIFKKEDFNNALLTNEQKKVVDIVYNYFGQYSAIALMNFTHNEKPWNSVEMNEEITDKLLVEYFDTIVVKDDDKV